MSLSVVSAGFLTTVQDQGRVGFRNIGVSLGGAADAHALRVANLLVGNEPSAAGLEVTLGGLRLRFGDTRLVAWCGGGFGVRAGGLQLSAGRAAVMKAGDELSIDRPVVGCRAWLAISGGIEVPVVMGSRSTDLRAQFGGYSGRALRDGDVLSLGQQITSGDAMLTAIGEARAASWHAPTEWAAPASLRPQLRVTRGMHWDSFSAEACAAFFRETFVVTAEADRMGVRLRGSALAFNGGELVSEAVASGTIQVPPSGEPIVLLPDCQTIGGYPRLAHVIMVDLPIAAQLRPGDEVRFREVTLAEAHQLLMQRERDLAFFRAALLLRTR